MLVISWNIEFDSSPSSPTSTSTSTPTPPSNSDKNLTVGTTADPDVLATRFSARLSERGLDHGLFDPSKVTVVGTTASVGATPSWKGADSATHRAEVRDAASIWRSIVASSDVMLEVFDDRETVVAGWSLERGAYLEKR